jgi:hypothetical protein
MAERKAAFTPVDDEPVTDGDLDKAAAAAVADDPEEIEKKVDELIEKSTDINGDGLPKDNKIRSDLGRKFSALHRRQDEFDSKLDKLLDVLTNQKEQDPLDDYASDETMTKSEAMALFRQLQKEEREMSNKEKQQYQNSYDDTLVNLSSEYSDEEANAIFNELQTMRYDPTNNAARDAEVNFLKAERAYLRKKAAVPREKSVPLKKDPVTGVVTNQKTPLKQEPNVKLSAAGQSYLDFVAKKDGSEKAQSLKKSLNA